MPNPDGTYTDAEKAAAAQAARQRASDIHDNSGLTPTLDPSTGTVAPPQINTPGDVAHQILSMIESGQQITTEQAVALRTALAAVQGIEGQQLRQQAAATLRTDANTLGNLTIGAMVEGANSIAREKAAASQANQQDQRSVAALGGAAAGANATDRSLVGAEGNYFGGANEENRGIVSNLTGALGTANMMDLQQLQQ